MQVPGFIEYLRLVDGHSHVLAKMFSPRGYQVFQTEQTGLIQAFVEPALERAVPPTCSLNFLHQNSKLLSILASDGVFDRYCDRAVVVFRDDGEIVQVIERRCFNAGFSGEVDRKSMPEGQPSERQQQPQQQRSDRDRHVLLPFPRELPQPPCCLALTLSGTNSSVREPIRASRAVQPPKARIPPAPKPRRQVLRMPSKRAVGG